MRILIYGVGVLGSYLAYELSNAGHKVAVLARGKRYDALKEQGLVIEHYRQKKTTTNQVIVTNTFNKTDEYDAVFVVMQRTQIDTVLSVLAANEKCRLYILVGNNGQVQKTYSDFMNLSHAKPDVLFGFLGSGGRNDNGRIISVHKDKVDFLIGDITNKIEYKETIGKIFEGTDVIPWYCDNADSWFKYHLAIILPIAYAVHSVNGDMKKLSKSGHILNLTIQAIREGTSLLEHMGYPPEPASIISKLKWPTWIWYLALKIVAKTETGRLAAGDHAMAAIGEMNMLSDEFEQIKKESQVETPAWDELAAYLIKD